MPETVDCIVVGAGVIGLAIARRLAVAGREVVVIEAEPTIAMHTSSRNSGVVHAGIYYPSTSLKARLCVAGREQLYEFCRSRGIGIARTGKLIVANGSSDTTQLQAIAGQGKQNGVNDLRWLDAREIGKIEPSVRCTGGVLSPSTGIVDAHGIVMALRAELESANGVVVCNSPMRAGVVRDDGIDVLTGADAHDPVRCRTLINAAGLWAPAVAAAIDRMPRGKVPASRYAKAHYFTYAGKAPFQRLVYPLPDEGGLGIHATLDLDGQLRFGPDVEWIDEISYAFDERRKQAFVSAILRYFPGLDAGRLQPGYTAVRPKLSGPGDKPADFVIQFGRDHGIPALVNLFGIESPGLTCCLAIADYVHDRLATAR